MPVQIHPNRPGAVVDIRFDQGFSAAQNGPHSRHQFARTLTAGHKIDVALLPIGAYEAPTGREVHMNPEEAVKAFLELRADTLIPMHYGTFRLGFEPLHEPPERLLAAARENGVEKKVLVMTEGKPVVL